MMHYRELKSAQVQCSIHFGLILKPTMVIGL